PRVGDRLEGPVERVRAAGLERHHEGLAAGVLDGVGELEDPRGQPVEDLHAHPGTRLGAGVAPGLHARLGRAQQDVDVGDVGVGDAEGEAVRRPLGRHDVLAAAGGVDREGGALPGLERRLALGGRGLAVHPWRRRLVERRVVLPRCAACPRRVETFAVLVEVGRRHPATMPPVTAVRKRAPEASHPARFRSCNRAVDTVCRMSVRGLLVALLCGVLGLAGGAAVAYAVSPHTTDLTSAATPVPARSPSVPIAVPPTRTYAPDISYPALQPGLAVPAVHSIRNDLASWTYHVPFGWTAYGVCTAHPCKIPTDSVVPPKQIDKQAQLRFRPAGEPIDGCYSLRVKILDNADLNPAQMVATKVVGFRQAFSKLDFSVLQ